MKKSLLNNTRAVIAAMFAIAFAMPQTAQAQMLTIDGTEIDLSASADLTGDWIESGKVHWAADTKTLTLDNATLVSKAKPDAFLEISKDFNIKVVGSNSITNDSYFAIRYSGGGTITINGGGSLNTKSSIRDIHLSMNGTLTIDGCEVETTKEIGNNNGPAFNNHLVVKNATLKTPYIRYLKSITLIDCHIQSPEGGQIIDKEANGHMGQTVVDANGKYPSNGIVIVPDGTDGITRPATSAAATVQEIYSLEGSRQPRMQRGVNIVKMSDGTTRKVVCRQ